MKIERNGRALQASVIYTSERRASFKRALRRSSWKYNQQAGSDGLGA